MSNGRILSPRPIVRATAPSEPQSADSGGSSGRQGNLQDTFLNLLRKNKIPVTMFLVKGVKLQGIVTWFDNFSILLRRDGQSQLVYKHAISTIMPGQLLDPQQFRPTRRKKAEAVAGRVPQPRRRSRSSGDDVPRQRRDVAGPDRRL